MIVRALRLLLACGGVLAAGCGGSIGDQNSPGNGLGGASGGGFASGAGNSSAASAAGHGGLATGGAMKGGATSLAGGGNNLGGASGAGGGATAGASGAAGGDENPYGACVGEDATDNSCPVPGSVCDAEFGCQPPCPTGTVSCPGAPAGGTATPYCQQRLCRLDCGFGKTCPAGMACNTANGFCTSNRL